MNTITLDTGSQCYPIYVGTDLLSRTALITPHIKGEQVLIITQTSIATHYLDRLQTSLTDYKVNALTLLEDEQHKNREQLFSIFDFLIAHQANRQATLIALGGGMVGDITGFAASCYQRGIRWIQIPTTLLAQVDASVGGKTAINYGGQKNVIGAFYQPHCVIADVATLTTLPLREYYAGFAEIIKYACIADRALLDELEKHHNALLNRDPNVLIPIISRCCEIKADIVAKDEHDNNVRKHLNFGHTFAHAIESLSTYEKFLHGEAVAIGMCYALNLSQSNGAISIAEKNRMLSLLKRFDLPTQLPANISVQTLIDYMLHDKKKTDKGVPLILLRQLGQAYVTSLLSRTQILSTLSTQI